MKVTESVDTSEFIGCIHFTEDEAQVIADGLSACKGTMARLVEALTYLYECEKLRSQQ